MRTRDYDIPLFDREYLEASRGDRGGGEDCDFGFSGRMGGGMGEMGRGGKNLTGERERGTVKAAGTPKEKRRSVFHPGACGGLGCEEYGREDGWIWFSHQLSQPLYICLGALFLQYACYCRTPRAPHLPPHLPILPSSHLPIPSPPQALAPPPFPSPFSSQLQLTPSPLPLATLTLTLTPRLPSANE